MGAPINARRVKAHDQRKRANARRAAQCHVYFVQAGENGPVKVGVAVDVERRMGELQCANFLPLTLLKTIKGTADHEFRIHCRLLNFCIRGEWFHP